MTFLTKDTAERLIEIMSKLNEAIDNLSKKFEAQPAVASSVVIKVEEQPVLTNRTLDDLYPVPPSYLEAVKEILNQEFKVKIVSLSDSPAFQLDIIVPDKYSTASKEHLKMYHGDIRSKVITYAMGSQGVRDWCEKVFNNFNPTIQAQIVADRIK